MNKLKIGIIGYGFVGQAVQYSFMTQNVETFIVDPKYDDNTLDDLVEWKPGLIFVCLPTPSNNDGSIDASLVRDTVKNLKSRLNTFIIIKSTITPKIVSEITSQEFNIAYVPEFLSEGNAKFDMVNSDFMVIGTNFDTAYEQVIDYYEKYSMCKKGINYINVTPTEASFVKYTINTFLAMKTAYFNELYSLADAADVNYQNILKGILADSRIGSSHTKVPGPDGKFGFGGACFPKDLNAFIDYSDNKSKLTILKGVRTSNNRIRSQYETDDREKANNIKFKQ